MGLCCLGGLRGLWGFCTRVELGGYMACGVFASVFLLLLLCLPPFVLCSSLLWLSLLVFLPCLCCFFFPFGYMRKKKGRNSLRPLFVSCGLVYKFLNITVICCGSSFPYL